LFGAFPEADRVVCDGNVITAGGVTAGIDFALAALAEIYGADVAEALQLGLEYDPKPPFDSGSPQSARPEILARVQATYGPQMDERRGEAREAARRLDANATAA
jgi:transcriptional regulator GlxA family with amidase domain